MRIDPVHVRERTPADMMIDTDQKAVFESLEPRAMDAVALKNNRRFVTAQDATRLHHLIRKRKRTVNPGNPIVKNDIRLLANLAQNLAARERRSHGIAIGTSVRRQHEPLVLSDLPEYILQHVAMPCVHLRPYAPYFVFSPAPTTLRHVLYLAPPDRDENTIPA